MVVSYVYLYTLTSCWVCVSIFILCGLSILNTVHDEYHPAMGGISPRIKVGRALARISSIRMGTFSSDPPSFARLDWVPGYPTHSLWDSKRRLSWIWIFYTGCYTGYCAGYQ